MNRLVPLPLLLLLAVAVAAAEPRPLPYDVLHLRQGKHYRSYTAPPSPDPALARGQLLRDVCAAMQPADTLVLAPTDFDLDGKNKGTLFLPDGIVLTTNGGMARLRSIVWSDYQGSAFEIKNGAFSNIAFLADSSQPNEDARCIEFYDGLKRTTDGKNYAKDSNGQLIAAAARPGVYSARFSHCEFACNDWVIYDWSGRGHRWRLEDCTIRSGRQGVSMMSGGGAGAQSCDLLRCRIDVDASRSQSEGATSHKVYGGAYGVVARGGVVRIIDCQFHMRGKASVAPSFTPRCVGIYDGNDFSSASSGVTTIEVANSWFYLDGNGASDVYDVLITNPGVRERLSLSRARGSGPGGAVRKNW